MEQIYIGIDVAKDSFVVATRLAVNNCHFVQQQQERHCWVSKKATWQYLGHYRSNWSVQPTVGHSFV